MKCNNCGFENREGVKFCEECTTELPNLSKIACSKCGFENRPGVRFCEECAHELLQPKKAICPNCGFENRPGIKFCEECAQPLSDEPVSQPAMTPSPSPSEQAPITQPVYVQVEQSQPKRRTLLWAVGSGMLTVLLCCFTYVLLPPLPASGDTALPDVMDTAWDNLVRRREYYKDQGGIVGNVVNGVEAIIPEPIKDAAGGILQQPNANDDVEGECPGFSITCRGRTEEECGLCGGEWKDFGDEQYCWCPGKNYTNKEWCEELIQGKWVEEEQRCTTLPGEEDNLKQISYCSDITYDGDNNEDYRQFRKQCMERGGFEDRIEEKGEEIAYCLCPQRSIIKENCDFFRESFEKDRELRFSCSAANNECMVEVKPPDILDLDAQFPDMVIKLKDGTLLSSEYVPAPVGAPSNQTTGGGGCQVNNFELWCRVPYAAGVDEDDIDMMVLCHNQCCVDLKTKEDEGFFGLTLGGSCPNPNDVTFKSFKVENGGWYSFDLINKAPWGVDIFYGDLYKGNGDYWHKYECTIDPDDANRMGCGSAPGETNIGSAVGSGYITFDPGVFGASCNSKLEVPVDYGTVAAPPSSSGGCPSGESMCGGSCCSIGYCCDWGSGLGCYSSCP